MGKTKALPAAVVLLALVSCGVPPATEPPTSSTTPTAACPSAGTEPQPANCFAYDGDAAMAQNQMYRQRRKLSPDIQSQLEQHIEPAKTALSALPQPVTANEIETAFHALGLREVQTDDGGNGVRFGVAVPSGGCIYGVIPREGELTLQAGGSIMDGGCLEMFGH